MAEQPCGVARHACLGLVRSFGSRERDACVMLAEGYEKLAALIEARCLGPQSQQMLDHA